MTQSTEPGMSPFLLAVALCLLIAGIACELRTIANVDFLMMSEIRAPTPEAISNMFLGRFFLAQGVLLLVVMVFVRVGTLKA